MGEIAMINPSGPHAAHEDAESRQMDPLMAITFGPRAGEPGSDTPAYKSNMAKATAFLKSMVNRLKAPKTMDRS
jgi:hypothetical protein